MTFQMLWKVVGLISSAIWKRFELKEKNPLCLSPFLSHTHTSNLFSRAAFIKRKLFKGCTYIFLASK